MKKKEIGVSHKNYELIFLTAYTLFLYGIGVLLTLYVQNAYFDIMEAKASCFRFILMILLPLLLLVIVLKIKNKKIRLRHNYLLLSLLFLALISLISTCISYDPVYAFTGESGWHVGSFAICGLILSVLAFEGGKIKEKSIYLPLAAVVLIEFILIILGGTRYNLFSFRTLIQGEDFYNFYGTLGNCNWITGYLSLFVPMFLCLYLNENNRFKGIFYYICCLAGVTASVINGADGIYLAYLFVFFFLIPHFLESISSLKKTSVLLTGFSIIMILIERCGFFDERIRRLNGFGPYIFKASLFLLPLGIVMMLLSRKIRQDDYSKIKRTVIVTTEIILICFAAGLVIYLFPHLSDDFGNGRIELWKFSLQKYLHDYSWKEKLFGVGPELLIDIYWEIDAGEKVFASSHSEPVQMLMSMGVLGFISWIMCWASIFMSYIKARPFKEKKAMAVYSGLFAYFAQSFVNSATIVNVCILTVFVILLTQQFNPDTFQQQMKKRKNNGVIID